VFTFAELAQFGVIQFETIALKISFYEKINEMDKHIKGGGELWFKNNRTFEQRARDKALGQFKHMLITKAKLKPEDVRIKWKYVKWKSSARMWQQFTTEFPSKSRAKANKRKTT